MEEKEEEGEDDSPPPEPTSGASASLQKTDPTHLTSSSESLFPVSGRCSAMLVPKYSARLITSVVAPCSFCKDPYDYHDNDDTDDVYDCNDDGVRRERREAESGTRGEHASEFPTAGRERSGFGGPQGR